MLTTTKQYLTLIAKGFCMGAADIVPGVSGGTMAFILGIYEELIGAIAQFGTKGFWKKLHFLIPVGVGILSAIALLSLPLELLLTTQPTMVWSFFFGLVLASIVLVSRRIKKWSPRLMVSALFGVLVAYVIAGLVHVSTPESPWFLMLSGAIAICAMILPGISGAFLLVLLGKYEFILSAVNNRELMPIIYVGIGAIVGILVFSRALKWLFGHYHDLTVALLIGLMIGSLRKLWPFDYATEGEFGTVISAVIVGMALVTIIEYLAHRKA